MSPMTSAAPLTLQSSSRSTNALQNNGLSWRAYRARANRKLKNLQAASFLFHGLLFLWSPIVPGRPEPGCAPLGVDRVTKLPRTPIHLSRTSLGSHWEGIVSIGTQVFTG